jgi:hypothetical protein
MKDKEQLYFCTQVQFRHRILTTIPGIKTAFKFGPNLLGVQTSLKRSDKFFKILICLDLPDCEFRLA